MKYEDLNRFKNISPLITERLILRKIKRADLFDVFKYASDGRVTRNLLWSPHLRIEDTKRYLSYIERKYRRGEFYDFGIEYQGHLVGTCGFTSFSVENNSAEIGYVLAADYWGMGIAPEALKRVIKYGFEELELNRIEGRFMTENSRSLAVMKKCGMSFEGVNKSKLYVKGEYRDIGVCAITRAEFENLVKLGTF